MGLVVCKTRADLADLTARWCAEGQRIGLVPTMGALHAGHISLIDAVAPKTDRVIVSIFVNPTQFGPNEDFEEYPRTLDADLDALASTKAHAVYCPRVTDLYPDGFDTLIQPGRVSEQFEGAERPGHFSGVATVVTKLIRQTRADVAIFGEKDFQQLAVLRQVARDLDLGTEIIGAPILREKDGLALSSRNRYLSVEERKVAGTLNAHLRVLKEAIAAGTPFAEAEDRCKTSLLREGFSRVDYVTIVDPRTLEPAQEDADAAHVLAVARIGSVRLLDNMRLK